MSRSVTTAGSHASLADVLARADTGPVPVPIAIQLAIAAARALEAMPGRPVGLSATHLAIDARGFVLVVPGAMRPAHASPEQAAGNGADARSEVFSLGVILWELLAGRPLFDRGGDAATADAIIHAPVPAVGSQNTQVPGMIADVLTSALAKSPESRFDNVGAFGRALAGARAATEVDEPSGEAISRWVTARLSRPVASSAPSVPDLDLPGSSRMQRSSGQMHAAAPPTSVRSAAAAAFSDLHLEVAVPAPMSSRNPPASSRQPPPPSLPLPPPAVPAHGIEFKTTDDDDDFDMPIERNLVSAPMQTTTSGRPSGLNTDGPPSSRRSLPSGSGLDLGAPGRLSARPARTTSRGREPGFFAKLLGFVVALVLFGATGAALVRLLHHAGGRSVTAYLPHAFDGTSANESGVVAVVCLVVAGSIVYLGLQLRPHAWWIIISGGALLLLALAMVTVTLASTGENPTPPDGVLLVPYLLPAAFALLALGMCGRAARIFTRSHGARKIGGVPIALIAGALVFAAFEISRLAAKL